MSGNPLLKKLRVQPPLRAAILSPPAGYIDLLSPLPTGVALSDRLEGTFGFIQLFTAQQSHLRGALPALLQHIDPGGLLWISFPKKSSGVPSDLSRDIVSEIVGEHGWDSVTIISIDSVWSSLRFRPAADVGNRKTRQ